MPNKIDDKTEQEIIKLYNDGHSTMKLAIKYNLHRSTIQSVLKRNDIELRKRTPVHYDVHFFDEYNENSCYWAGFIAADGYVRSDRAAVTIHLSSADYEHLLKLAKLTNYEGSVKLNKNECYITFAGKWFKNALDKNFDIHPNKTFDVTISDKIPKDMIKHFIRGYFDGDGSVTHVDNYLRINFTSGSETMLKQIMSFIYNNNVVVRNKTGVPPIYGYVINYSCSAAHKILDILYGCSSELARLDRKYQLYLNYKNLKAS